MTFREAFCRKFECSDAKFEEEVFHRILYPHAHLFVLMLKLFRPGFFRYDYELIRSIGDARSASEVMAEINAYHSDYQIKKSFLRRTMRIRISGDKLSRLVHEVFRESKP